VPTYQYACTECRHRFDAVQSFHEDSLTHCPECAGRIRKIFNAVGVVFKGSGFYRNDSRPTVDAAAASTSSDTAPTATPAGDSGSKSTADSGSSSPTPAATPASTPATPASTT